MAITNYGELKTAISNQIGADISADVDDIVTMAQDYLSVELRHRRMITTTTLSPTTGEFTIPTDYRYFKEVVELASSRRDLEVLSAKAANREYPTRPSGLACHFTIIGNVLRAFPTITNDIELSYYADLAAFSDDSDTDWLLTKSPMLYLRVCQMMAADFLLDDDAYAVHEIRAQRYISRLNVESDLAEFAQAGLTLSGPTP